jgi:hypothetical protein
METDGHEKVRLGPAFAIPCAAAGFVVQIRFTMTRDEYEERKAKIEEQLRAGVELLQAACRRQMEALDLLWGAGANEEPAAIVPARVAEKPLPRRRAWGLYDEVRDAILNLPEVFHRGHVCDQLGYQPDRSSLFRALREMVEEGILAIQSQGDNRRPTLYRRTDVTVRVADG